MDQAIINLEEAIKLHQSHSAVYYNELATAYLAIGKIDQTIKLYKTSVLLEPQNSQYIYNLGTALLLSKNYKESARELKKASRLSPYNPDIYYSLAEAYEKDENYAEAANAYENFLKYNPDFSEKKVVLQKIDKYKSLNPEIISENVEFKTQNHDQSAIFKSIKNLFR